MTTASEAPCHGPHSPRSWLAKLVEPVADAVRDHPDSNGDLESIRKMRTQRFGKLGGTRREDVDVLIHARFIHISVDCMSAEEHCIGSPAQKLEHGVMDCRQRQWLAHRELSERR
jgi:hypothetical protein